MHTRTSPKKNAGHHVGYRHLFENMQYGCVYCKVIFNEEGRPVDFIHEEVNAGYEKLTGLTNVVGLKASEVFPDIGNSDPEFIENHLRVADTGKPGRFEFYLEPLHQWFDISVYSTERVYFTAIIDNITDRKEAEERLRKSEYRFKALFDDHSAIKLVLDFDTGDIIDANHSAAIFYGWPTDELCRMNLQQIEMLSPTELTTEIPKSRYNNKNNFSCKHRKSNNSVCDVEVFSNSITVAGKALLFLIIYDVTERIQAEREREKLQEQLQHSQKLEMIGQLAGGIAHDFNNMLGVILGHAEMALLEEKLPECTYTDLTAIKKAAIHSANLTQQLLAFARKQIAIPKVTELNVAVKAILSLLQRLIGEDITLQWIPDAQEALLKIDPSQLDQILTNLTTNARDAISGTGTITIETSRQACQNVTEQTAQSSDVMANYVTITVTDTGCGISKTNLPHIFEPFFTTKGVGKGTGLGLSTVYGIVKQNHGFIECESTPDKGTCIKIQLPMYTTECVELESKPTEPLIRHLQQSVLLVEDQPDILGMCKRILEQQGLLVIPAETPQEAILIAEKHKNGIDLLLTDVVMPEMNGCDLSNKLLITYPNLKTLFMSGYTSDIIASHGVISEDVNFIQKPFTIKALINSVHELLNSSDL